MTARELAFAVLNRCEKNQQYSNLALDAALKKASLQDSDRALATALVYGVLETRQTLDYQISLLSARKMEEISGEILTVLRMGLYQLKYLDRIPDHAAVNEAVSMAGKKAGGFVNAILRSFIRRKKELCYPPKEDTVAYLSVKYSVGEALCREFLKVFGAEKTEDLLKGFEEHASVTLRTNTLKISREELLMRLRNEGYGAEPTEQSEDGIRLLGNAPIPALPGFEEGCFFVQDEASQLAVQSLDLKKGMQVLDCCACPGSKSFGIAMKMENTGSLISCDLHASKLSLVKSGALRLGIDILEVRERDATKPQPDWTEKFDRILCDVPCSGFGVLSKKPELRYKDPEVSRRLPDIQLAILERSSEFLKAGGKLVYSTCTVLPAENEENVSRFLEAHGEFELLNQRTFYPAEDGTDGFFVAVLQKMPERTAG